MAPYAVTDLPGQNPLTLYQWASSYSTAGALGGTPVPTGAVNIVGMVNLFQGTPEFIPFSITPVPEPASIGLFLDGMAVLVRLARRRVAGKRTLLPQSIPRWPYAQILVDIPSISRHKSAWIRPPKWQSPLAGPMPSAAHSRLDQCISLTTPMRKAGLIAQYRTETKYASLLGQTGLSHV